MSDSKVRVTADKGGSVIIPSEKNLEYGYIRVEQDRMLVDDKGFARKKTITALIPGKIEDLKGFGWVKDQEVEGKIIAKEQLKPFNSDDPKRDYKIAGKTNVICCVGEEPIYRKTFFTLSPKAEDVLLAHTNGEEIKAAYAELLEQEKEDKI